MKMPGEKSHRVLKTQVVEPSEVRGGALPKNYPIELERTFHLKHGGTLQIRPIKPDDSHLLRYASSLCPPETLFRRFNTSMHELSDEYSHYLTHIDYQRHLALIAIDPEGELIVAVARYVVPTEAELCEIAIIVGDPYQGQGLATTLLKDLLDAAKTREIKGFEAYIQLDNDPAGNVVRSIAEKSNFVLHTEIELGTKHVWIRFDETP
ncbi:MAG: GNAT family N-acetyltransferase [Proteobacteria bacterium]|nr:GNAT family N-acetyltransferase [Pseudomonadota bacterium]